MLVFLGAYRRLTVPAYIDGGAADHLSPVAAMRQVESRTQARRSQVRVTEDLPHSAWPVARHDEIFRETLATIANATGSES